MTRTVLGWIVLIVSCLVVAVGAQTIITIYNPVGFQFEHGGDDGYVKTDRYRFNIIIDAGQPLPPPTYFYEIPKTDAVPVANTSPQEYTVAIGKIPALPVGKSYRAMINAIGTDGTSDPSNVTPEAMRFSTCALTGGTGVAQPSLAIQSLPVMKVDEGTALTLSVRAPHPVQFLMLDLIGDNQPAWYYVTNVPVGAPSTALVFFGPHPRAGKYELQGQIIDSGGCMASLPFGTYLTVQ